MSTSIFNRRWAHVLLQALSRHGVIHVCIAPGSRSTPLTLEAAENSKFICHTHFDERGLGFLALGLAKGSKQPVAIIVTSGTAVANLYPALIEANLTGEKLILLTADRPPEQIDCGANQAIDQQGIFANHVSASLNLPRPTLDIPAKWLVSAVDDTVSQAKLGCVHINCPFAEPLYGGDPLFGQNWSAQLADWWQSEHPWLDYSTDKYLGSQPDWSIWREKRGVVVAGRLSAAEGKYLADWAKCMGWPLLSDIQSSTGQPLAHADLWLAMPKAQAILANAELVIQFGSYLTGKRLLNWQKSIHPKEYWLIDHLTGRRDPAHHHGRRIVADIIEWLTLHPAPSIPFKWADSLSECAAQASTLIKSRLNNEFGEVQVAARLPELLPKQGQLFVGNSLSIRLIDALAKLPKGYPVFANRGTSGIDGLIATVAGISRTADIPILSVIGDISALYDLNSLSLLRVSSLPPMVILIINNNGGSIFSMLPTPENQRERFYRMPHQLNFKHAAAMFELDYHAPINWQQLSTVVHHCWQNGGIKLVELCVAKHRGASEFNELVSEMGNY